MALFRRGARSGPDPDEELTFFTAGQASRFRQLVRAAFAEAGLEVTVYAGHVADSDGRRFGLGNLAAACRQHERGERGWPEAIREHVSRMLRAMAAPSPFETMTTEQVRDATYLRLYDGAPAQPFYYGRELAPGVTEVLNLDLPETVAFFADEHVAMHGPYEQLRAAGLANLRTVQPEEHEELTGNGARLHVLAGASMFTASLAIVLDEVADRYGEPVDVRYGAFVAMPFRHQLAYHPIHDGAAAASLNALAAFARAGWSDGPGPVSPHAYWWRAGELRQLSREDGDRLIIEVGPDLADVLNEVS